MKKPNTKNQRMTQSLTLSINSMFEYNPITANQEKAFEAWDEGDHLVLVGSAGTGKTFIAMYMAIESLLEENSDYEKVVIIRSVVPTRDQGFLPGTQKEKEDAFTIPYRSIAAEIFGDPAAYNKLVTNKQVSFESTSFIRGATFNNAIVIVDEMQNLNFHELDSVITRCGQNCKIIFSGDYKQSDFKKEEEREGIIKFLHIIEHLNNFTVIQFNWEDIVRSGLVRDYIMTKEMLGY
jgi:phosphate starvation-inducible protein PhoH and related proteins